MTAANHCVRLNDSLNCKLVADEYEPEAVLRGSTSVASKDGLPMELYCPAMGWLGPITWVAEHLAELSGLRAAIARADVVLTGEGRFDEQSRTGKVVGSLLDLGATGVIAGQVTAPTGAWTSRRRRCATRLQRATSARSAPSPTRAATSTSATTTGGRPSTSRPPRATWRS